jgi:hypothetical protein
MPGWLHELLPSALKEWLTPGVLLGLGVFGVVAFIASLLGVPWFLARMPPDHFLRIERTPLPRGGRAMVLRALLNLVGALLVLVGILLLVLPGQGLLTIVVGLVLLDFPGKRRFERWLVNRGPVLRSINALRRRVHQPPLELRDSWLPPADDSRRDFPH